MTPKKNESAFGIVLKENKLLLTLRKDVAIWVLPGGGIEPNESPEQACLREVFEETGVKATLIKKTHLMSPVNNLTLTTHLYLCKPLNEPTKQSDESLENRYFNLDNLPKDFFWPHRLWVEEAILSKDLIERPLKEITYFRLCCHLLAHPWQTLRFLYTRFTKH